jgi:transposase-like protein
VQFHRNKKAVARFFKQLLDGLKDASRVVVTDKLTGYSAPCAELFSPTSCIGAKRG